MMMKLLVGLATFFVLLFSSHSAVLAQSDQERLEGEIVSVTTDSATAGDGSTYLIQTLQIEITRGSLLGRTIEVVNNTVSISNAQEYQKGDQVVVTRSEDFEGKELFYITDYVRRDAIMLLFLLFAVLAVVVGGKWGGFSLVGMAASFFIIFKVILPLILSGQDPIVAALLGAALIIPITFYLSHGVQRKTHIAIASTLITLVITGVLATVFVQLTHLTGFASEEAVFLTYSQNQLNMKGLLLAGIIIGTLGVLDDITISQASIVEELKKANSKLSSTELFIRAMRVGRDHIASLINTLVLVYTGASLPLLLLFLNADAVFSELVNFELIADEMVRTLVGSIGLIMAVPITSFFAAKVAKK